MLTGRISSLAAAALRGATGGASSGDSEFNAHLDNLSNEGEEIVKEGYKLVGSPKDNDAVMNDETGHLKRERESDEFTPGAEDSKDEEGSTPVPAPDPKPRRPRRTKKKN